MIIETKRTIHGKKNTSGRECVQKRMRLRRNPLLASYLSLALLCCAVLTAAFLYAGIRNSKTAEKSYHEEKLSLTVDDFAVQMEELSTIGLKISVDRHFQPFYFERNKYYEQELLELFKSYTHYTVYSTTYFLYYPGGEGSEHMFTSSGETSELDLYLAQYLPEDQILPFTQNLSQLAGELHFDLEGSRLFVLLPLNIMHTGEPNAVLCFIIPEKTIAERMDTVSGGLTESLSLYCGNTLLYRSDTDSPAVGDSKGILSGHSGDYTIVLKEKPSAYIFVPLQILLVLCCIFLLLMIASFLAWRSSMPLVRLADKLKASIPQAESAGFISRMDEINDLADQVIQRETQAVADVSEKQKKVQDQALLMLLSSRFSFDLKPFLEESGLTLPGPWYSVLCISIESTNNPEALKHLDQILRELSDSSENQYLYPVRMPDQPVLAVIASIAEASRWNLLCNDIRELSESILPECRTASGGCYQDAGRLSAAYLEAVDRLHQPPETLVPAAGTGVKTDIWQMPDYQPILRAMENGSEELALSALSDYAGQLGTSRLSILMEQYVIADFLSKVTETADRQKITLSRQSVSLILTSGRVSDFERSASRLLKEYFAQYRAHQEALARDEDSRVLQYIDTHFTSFDFSIESAAAGLSLPASAIRAAVRQKAGKTFRDYVIEKRMELAGSLLTGSDLSVSEVCEKIGYTNVSYFIKAFKARYGETPANFRLNRRKGGLTAG